MTSGHDEEGSSPHTRSPRVIEPEVSTTRLGVRLMLDIQPIDALAAHDAAGADPDVITKSAATPLFRNRSFLRLWFVAAATQVGGHMALYAMTILVFSTTRSNTAVSALLMTYMLPQVLLSPFAGVIIDRVNLRWAMIGPNAVRAALMVGLALAGVDVPILLLLNVGISLTGVALMPTEGSFLPRVVSAAQLETALGIFNLTFQASFAVGFAFAGPLLVVVFGPSVVLGVVAAFYIAATVMCVGLPTAPPEVRPADHLRRSDAIQPLRELLEELAKGLDRIGAPQVVSRSDLGRCGRQAVAHDGRGDVEGRDDPEDDRRSEDDDKERACEGEPNGERGLEGQVEDAQGRLELRS